MRCRKIEEKETVPWCLVSGKDGGRVGPAALLVVEAGDGDECLLASGIFVSLTSF